MVEIILLLSTYQRRRAPCWRCREHFADPTPSSLIGALYLWPLSFAICKKINNLLPIVIAVGAALAVLVITLIAIPVLLPISTFAFVIASAGTSAIAVAKAI